MAGLFWRWICDEIVGCTCTMSVYIIAEYHRPFCIQQLQFEQILTNFHDVLFSMSGSATLFLTSITAATITPSEAGSLGSALQHRVKFGLFR